MVTNLPSICQPFDTICIKAQTQIKRSTNECSMNWLRDRRKQVGIETVDDLAVQLQLAGYNIGRSAVSHWENERSKPPLKDIELRRALATVLKLSEPELLRMAGYEIIANHTEAGERAAHIVDELPPEKQDIILKMLEALAG